MKIIYISFNGKYDSPILKKINKSSTCFLLFD